MAGSLLSSTLPAKTKPNKLLSNLLTLNQAALQRSGPYKIQQIIMLKKGEHIEGTPTELQVLLNEDAEANTFFESLSKSYKQGYCD